MVRVEDFGPKVTIVSVSTVVTAQDIVEVGLHVDSMEMVVLPALVFVTKDVNQVHPFECGVEGPHSSTSVFFFQHCRRAGRLEGLRKVASLVFHEWQIHCTIHATSTYILQLRPASPVPAGGALIAGLVMGSLTVTTCFVVVGPGPGGGGKPIVAAA